MGFFDVLEDDTLSDANEGPAKPGMMKCTACQHLIIGMPAGKCPSCGAEVVAVTLEELNGEERALADGVAKTLEQPKAEGAPPKKQKAAPYSNQEFMAELKGGKCWNVERLVATVHAFGRQLNEVGRAGLVQSQELQVMRDCLGVVLKRNGGTMTLRQRDFDGLHPKFEVNLTELPPDGRGKVFAVGYREPAPTIQIATSLPPMPTNGNGNGRRQ